MTAYQLIKDNGRVLFFFCFSLLLFSLLLLSVYHSTPLHSLANAYPSHTQTRIRPIRLAHGVRIGVIAVTAAVKHPRINGCNYSDRYTTCNGHRYSESVFTTDNANDITNTNTHTGTDTIRIVAGICRPFPTQ